MLVNLHTHTNEYSSCSKITPYELIEAAINRGLGGIAITEHNYIRTRGEIEKLRKKYPQIKIFNGIEVSVKEDEHILVFGVLNPKHFYKLMPISQLEDIVKSEGGVMVLAHPYRYKDTVDEAIINSSVSALEIASTNVKSYMIKGFEYLQRRKPFTKVMGGDVHVAEAVGIFSTRFKTKLENDADLVNAIKSDNLTVEKDVKAIERLNESLQKKIPVVLDLIEKGYSNPEIRDIVGRFSNSNIWALKNKKDILYSV